MRRLRTVPLARRYLLGQSLSILGDSALWLAMAIWVRELTGSNAEAGLTFFFLAVPSLAGPMWGTVADRFRRRPVLIAGNLASAAMTMALLGVHGRHQVWLIWGVMAGYGASGSLLSAAQSGFIKTLVPDDRIGDAQGWLSTVREGLRLIAPLIGAGLFTLVGGHAVAVLDAATFVVAAVSVASIRIVEPAGEPRSQPWRTEVAAGWQHIATTVALRQVVVALAAVCAVIGLVETAGIAVITTGLHRSPAWLGAWQMLMGAGALVGGPTVGRAMRRFGEGRVAAVGMAGWAIACTLLVFPDVVLVAAGGVLAGFALPWMIAASSTFVQRATPGPLQGRVSATVDVLTGTPQSVSIAVGAALLTVVGYQVLLGVVATVTLAAGVWLASRPEHRRGRLVSFGLDADVVPAGGGRAALVPATAVPATAVPATSTGDPAETLRCDSAGSAPFALRSTDQAVVPT
jgi:MFS family permease